MHQESVIRSGMATAAGYAIRPSDHDLITLVLRPLVARQQRVDDGGGGGFIHLADVYSAAPERLAERYAPLPGTDGGGGRTWYFLCPARCRHRAAAGAPGEGCWRSETGEVRPVRDPDGRRVGHSRTLSYGAKTTAPCAAVTRHGWRMVELALDDQGDGAGDLVLCKVFRSPGTEAPMVVASTATAVTAFIVSKRKAVDQHPEAPPSVRQHC